MAQTAAVRGFQRRRRTRLVRAGSARLGVQSELLLGLALVMALATLVLAAVLVVHGEARLRDVLGRALVVEAQATASVLGRIVPGTVWWTVGPAGQATPRGGEALVLDPAGRALATRARSSGEALLLPGAAWEAIRFAAPLAGSDQVAVARLPRAASVRLRLAPLAVALAVLIADVLIFSAFGAYLLRRRIVKPLAELAQAADALAAGDARASVPAQGAREIQGLAHAFNDMTGALERRTGALEKAVSDLRRVNADLRQARDGLDRAERLASVGRLAAGVAHEVGNPIAAMMAFLDLAGRDDGISDTSKQHLCRASREGERVGRILRQLLDFSRPARGLPAPLDLTLAAEETFGLVRAQQRYEAVSFERVTESGTRPAHADRSAVAQILLNLVLNAADAVLEQGEGRVEVRVAPAALAAREGESPEAARSRRELDAVECLVCDTGVGVPGEDRERIFDPFFTTKPAGQGTGLGLANALRLAEEQGGTIELAEPPPGFRTAFALRLPRRAEQSDSATACETRSELRALRGGSPPEATEKDQA
jgi:signal transduction histidine kinase